MATNNGITDYQKRIDEEISFRLSIESLVTNLIIMEEEKKKEKEEFDRSLENCLKMVEEMWKVLPKNYQIQRKSILNKDNLPQPESSDSTKPNCENAETVDSCIDKCLKHVQIMFDGTPQAYKNSNKF